MMMPKSMSQCSKPVQFALSSFMGFIVYYPLIYLLTDFTDSFAKF